MQLLCPACRTPLPGAAPDRAAVLTCSHCSAEVDVSRAGTAAGRPRFVPEIDRSGDTVSGFVLEQRIGAGGMGTVYRARRPGDASPVAVKFLSPALSSEPDVVARFHREVKLLKSLSHPSIVRVIDHGDENGIPWFAMELVDGLDLRGRLAKGALSLEECGQVFGRLFEALGHAHEKGIIHRDLKPANVLLAADGAKLADFGIARPDPDGASHATKLTETAAVLGTFPYMSPEQRAGAEVDRRSDLFSTGVLLYEALTGKLPQGAFALPSRVNPALPARLDLVVSKLLQPDRESRYATAEDAALAFHAAIRPRASMAPVVGFGAIAAVALALVVPAAFDMGTMTAGGKKLAAASPAPTATPAIQMQAQAPQAYAGNAQDVDNSFGADRFLSQNDDDTNPTVTATPAPAMSDEERKKLQAKTKNAKPIAKGDDDDDTPAVANAPPEVTPTPVAVANEIAFPATSGNRAETNFIKAIETQAVSPDNVDEIVPMTTTCSPTLVYDTSHPKAKVLGKLKKGHKVDKLKSYRSLAVVIDSVLGYGAGLFGMAEPRSKTKQAAAPANEESQQLQQQAAPIPEVLWHYVRYSEKDEKGWILGECAAAAKSSTPAYRTTSVGYEPQKGSLGSSSTKKQ